MLSLSKKTTAVLIVITGLLASFFIIKSPAKDGSGITSLTTKSNSPGLNLQQSSSKNIQSAQVGYPIDENQNLTEELAKIYARTIIDANSNEGLSPAEKQQAAVFSPETAGEIVERYLPQEMEITAFTDADLKIFNSNSTADQLSYLEAINNLSEKNFTNLKANFVEMLDEWALNQNNEPIEEYVSRIPKHINDLLSLAVPSGLADFHLQNLNLWQKKLTVFAAILNMNDDPLKTFLAVQELPTIVEESFALQDFIEDKYQNLRG